MLLVNSFIVSVVSIPLDMLCKHPNVEPPPTSNFSHIIFSQVHPPLIPTWMNLPRLIVLFIVSGVQTVVFIVFIYSALQLQV